MNGKFKFKTEYSIKNVKPGASLRLILVAVIQKGLVKKEQPVL